jgi:hypothetical protein
MLRTALIFSIVVVAYDALSASIAAWLGITYDSFLVLLLVLFFFMGIYAGRKRGSWGGISPIVIAAVVDATAGWYVAAAIGPGYVPGWTMRMLIVMGVESAVLAAAAGAAGVAVGVRVAGARRGVL